MFPEINNKSVNSARIKLHLNLGSQADINVDPLSIENADSIPLGRINSLTSSNLLEKLHLNLVSQADINGDPASIENADSTLFFSDTQTSPFSGDTPKIMKSFGYHSCAKSLSRKPFLTRFADKYPLAYLSVDNDMSDEEEKSRKAERENKNIDHSIYTVILMLYNIPFLRQKIIEYNAEKIITEETQYSKVEILSFIIELRKVLASLFVTRNLDFNSLHIELEIVKVIENINNDKCVSILDPIASFKLLFSWIDAAFEETSTAESFESIFGVTLWQLDEEKGSALEIRKLPLVIALQSEEGTFRKAIRKYLSPSANINIYFSLLPPVIFFEVKGNSPFRFPDNFYTNLLRMNENADNIENDGSKDDQLTIDEIMEELYGYENYLIERKRTKSIVSVINAAIGFLTGEIEMTENTTEKEDLKKRRKELATEILSRFSDSESLIDDLKTIAQSVEARIIELKAMLHENKMKEIVEGKNNAEYRLFGILTYTSPKENEKSGSSTFYFPSINTDPTQNIWIKSYGKKLKSVAMSIVHNELYALLTNQNNDTVLLLAYLNIDFEAIIFDNELKIPSSFIERMKMLPEDLLKNILIDKSSEF